MTRPPLKKGPQPPFRPTRAGFYRSGRGGAGKRPPQVPDQRLASSAAAVIRAEIGSIASLAAAMAISLTLVICFM